MKRHRRGFTLLEVLIAIALMLALLGALYAFLFNMMKTRSEAVHHIRREAAVSALFRQLEGDLLTCIAADSVNGSGVQGDSAQIRVLHRGVAVQRAAFGPDDAELFSDLQFAEYRFDAEAQRLEARRGPGSSMALELPPFTPLGGPVHRLRFRYFDGDAWSSTYDSRERGGLPVAIEIALWLHDSDAGVVEEIDTEDDQETASPPDRVRVMLVPDARSADMSGLTGRTENAAQ